MKAVSFFAKVLWILCLAAAAAQGARAFDGCRAADVNGVDGVGDGVVDQVDVDILISLIGSPSPREDLDGSGIVDEADVAIASGFLNVLCTTCPADFSGNGWVCEEERELVEGAYGRDCRADLNRDGAVDELDSSVLEAYLGGCPLSRAAEQADFNGDEVVDDSDRSFLEGAFGTDCQPDLNGDGTVDTNDLGALHAAWGPCPGMSAGHRGDFEPTCDQGEGPLPPLPPNGS